MSNRDEQLPPGSWVPNDFTVGDRLVVGAGRTCTVIYKNNLHYSQLLLTVDWDDPVVCGNVWPNLEWVGLLPKEEEQ